MPTLNNKKQNKGQSLVEVIVALGILAIVFASVVTLVVYALNMAVSARNRTEAIALAQEKVADATNLIQGNCPVLTATDVDQNGIKPSAMSRVITMYNAQLTGIGETTITNKRVTAKVEALSSEEDHYTGGTGNLPAGKFLKIIVTVRWNDRGISGEQIFIITQLVRIN